MGLDLFVLIDNVFGVVHEFLPRTSYLCTVYSVSSILTAPCLFPRRKGLRGARYLSPTASVAAVYQQRTWKDFHHHSAKQEQYQ